MKHVVLRIIDGLPAYIKEEHAQFVALMEAYYTWQTRQDKVLGVIYGHEDLLDIDVNGLARSIEELDEEFIPVEHRRTWAMFSQEFNASRGSIQSFKDLFRIVYNSPVEIENTSRFVFKPSAASRLKYYRMLLRSAQPLPLSGVVVSVETGIAADIVESCQLAGTDGVHELLVSPRDGDFRVVDVEVVHGSHRIPAQIVGHAAFTVASGHAYRIGDAAVFEGLDCRIEGRVSSMHPADVTGVNVVVGGTGYRIGDVVTMPGARGWRGEVAAVGSAGEVQSVRIIDRGDPFKGDASLRLSSAAGVGAVLRPLGIFGRPAEFTWDATPFGTGVVSINSDTGEDATVDVTHFNWYPTYIQTGFNGVIGIGSVITDSDVWQDSSYRVKTPADYAEWGPVVKKMLHPAGKNMGVVKTVSSTVRVSGAFTAVSDVTPV